MGTRGVMPNMGTAQEVLFSNDPARGAIRPLLAALDFEELDACFVVRDHSGHKLAHVYFDDEPGRRSAAKLLKRCTSRKCNTPQ